ncbi:MAG: DUF1425 domain-containing protein [Puniceicoccales bacterium]
MIRASILLSILTISALFSGCDSAEAPTDTTQAANPMAMSKVDIDPQFARTVSVLNVEEVREGDAHVVRVELENLNYESVDFNFQFAWYLADGTEVNSPPPIWKPGFILARERIYLRGVAPFDNVTDFRLKLVTRDVYNSTIAKGK